MTRHSPSIHSKTSLLVVALFVAIAGCDTKEEPKKAEDKKAEDKKADGKPADAKATAAAPSTAAAPTPSAEGIKVKANFEEYNGTYGSGVWQKHFSGSVTLAFATECPKFGCEHWSTVGTTEDAFKTDCPKGRILEVEFKNANDVKVGMNEGYLDLDSNDGGTTMTARDSTAKIDISKLGDDTVVGTIDFGVDAEDETMAKGAFTAKVCPPPKEE